MDRRSLPRPWLIPALVLLVSETGCSYFMHTKKLDMEPFAENTVTAIGEMRRIETPPIWIRLRKYYNHSSVVAARKATAPLLALVRGVNGYSLQVVSLNESRIAEKNKVRELAKFLHQASQQALWHEADPAEISLTPARREQIVEEIEKQETFMEALMAAEPIVNAVLARGLDIADDVDEAILKAFNDIEADLQDEYRDMLANRATLVELQQRTIRAQSLAEKMAFGDEAAAVEFRKAVPTLTGVIPASARLGAKEPQDPVTVMAAQALRVRHALDQIDPEYQAYREAVRELDQLRVRKLEAAKMARSLLLVWSRSHKNLARGVEVPPMFDLGKILLNTASTAASAAVPF